MILSILPDHNGLKLENNLKEKTQKHSNSRKLNAILLNNEWINSNELKEEIKSFWKQIETSEQNIHRDLQIKNKTDSNQGGRGRGITGHRRGKVVKEHV